MKEFELFEKVMLIGNQRKYEIGTLVELDEERQTGMVRMVDNYTIEESYENIHRHPYGYIGYEERINDMIMDYFPEPIAFFKLAMRLREEIKTKDGILIICVGDNDEYKTPHLHIFRSRVDMKNWTNGGCLLMDRNSYLNHFGCNDRFTQDELMLISEKLKENVKGINISNFKLLISSWNDENPGYEISTETEIVDYNAETISVYEEWY